MLSENVRATVYKLARVRPLLGKDLLVIVVADTDHLLGSILSACVLKHPGRSKLVSGLSGSSLRFRDTLAFSAAIYLFRSYLLLPRLFASSAAICSFRDYLPLSRLFAYPRCFAVPVSFHIPNDVHPQLPSPNQTIHEMPIGKIGVYTRFFEFANFRLPLSTFLVNVLSVHGIEPTAGFFHCFYVNIKNKRWMSFSKRPDSDAMCYTKPLDSLKRWNDHFFWVDSFACPASFSWHTGKNVSRDPFPKSTEFSADDYVVLVAHLAPFWKFLEPFLCLIEMSRNYTLDEDTCPTFLHDDGTEMDLLAFIQVADPTKVKVRERERAEEEARLLDSTVGRVVPLLSVTPARADSELEASVDRLFDEGSSVDQGDSAAGGGQETETEIVTGVRFVADENVVTKKLKRPRKKRQAATAASGSSHPPKKLKGDHKTFSGAATGGKSSFVLKELLASSMLNVEVGVATMTTKARRVGPSYSAQNKSNNGLVASLYYETIHQVFVPQWNVLNDSLPDDYDVSREFVDHLDPPALFSQMREMDYHHLFRKFNVGTTSQACLNAEAEDDEVESFKAQLLLKETEAAEATSLRVQVAATEAMDKMHVDEIDALKRKNVVLENEKESPDRKVAKLQSLVSTKDIELKDLNVVVSSLRSQKDSLVDQVHALETTCSGLRDQVSKYERLKEQIEDFQDSQMNIVNDKVAKLDADLLEMTLHLKENFYPHLLTIICGRRWLLTHGLKLAVVKCLNYQEYLLALKVAISRAIEKGMQDGLAAGIDHGKAGKSLADIVAYKPAAEADYNSALQRLREVEFLLLADKRINACGNYIYYIPLDKKITLGKVIVYPSSVISTARDELKSLLIF
ncbi:hypothetical protein Tco_0818306 [Tanacetum coccineum]